MESKTKVMNKKFLTFVTILVLAFSVSFSPVAAPRAQAFLGFGDITIHSIPTILSYIWDKVGKQLAQRMIDDIVQSTIQWANTGFDGNPSFITDSKDHFNKIASGTIGDAINDGSLDFLCSPFQAQIKLSLVKQYSESTFNPQCTLEEIGANWDDFQDNFDNGGWSAWLKMTQEEQNNPIGAYVAAKADIDSRLANTLNIAQDEQKINLGFLSKTKCLKKNQRPPESEVDRYNDGDSGQREKIKIRFPNWDPKKDQDACLEEEVITPGGVISQQLNKALGSGIDKLISADDIDALASALLAGLLQRHVFNDKDKGLFDKKSISDTRDEIIDIDEDGLPDGFDYDGDGVLDICHHGLNNPNEGPSNENCLLSGSVSNSPYFIPICRDIPSTIRALEVFNDFITRNDFKRENSTSWSNRMTTVNSSVDDLISTISRYEIIAWDPVVFTLGKYTKYIGGRTSSLLQDEDLKFGGGSDIIELAKLRNNTTKVLEYSRGIKERIGQCDSPDIGAINQVPPPTFEGDEEDTSTTTPPTTSDEPRRQTTTSSTLSCSPATNSSEVGRDVQWVMTSDYPTGTTYRWFGDEITSTDTFFVEPLIVRYNFVGAKSANILATTPSGQAAAIACAGTVTVTDSVRNNPGI